MLVCRHIVFIRGCFSSKMFTNKLQSPVALTTPNGNKNLTRYNFAPVRGIHHLNIFYKPQGYHAICSDCFYLYAEIIPVYKIKSDIFIIHLKIKLLKP
jgi:hypothetical protein